MSRKYSAALSGLAFFCLLCLCSGASFAADHGGWEREVAERINAERRKQGRQPLAVLPELGKAAAVRAGELMRKWGSIRPDGSAWSAVLTERGLRFARVAEMYNTGPRSPRSPREFVERRRDSPYIAGPLYTGMGVAVRQGRDGNPVWEVIVLESPGAGPAFARETLGLINAERQRRGLPPLAASERLNAVARIRAGELRTHFEETRPNGRHWYTLLNEKGIAYSLVGDAYGRGYASPRAAVRAWVERDAGVLSTQEYREAGVGVCSGTGGKTYWYAIAIKPKDGSAGVKAPDAAPRATDMDGYAAEVLRLTNVERRKAGLSALAPSAVMDTIAGVRAREIIGKFSHTRPDGSSWSSLLERHNVAWRANGENIAAGQKDPKAVVAAWMASPGHRENILTGKFTHLGVGVRADAKGRLNWVQCFLTPQ